MDAALLSLRGFSTDRLALFCEVARAGGISAAFRDDPDKQNKASRWIGELEVAVGFPLTQRQGRTLIVNAAGARLARLLRSHFDEVDSFVREQRNAPVVVRIGAGNSVITWQLASKLGSVRARHPQCAFDLESLRTDSVLLGLNDLTLDLGILRTNAIPEAATKEKAKGLSLETRPFAEVRYKLFVPAALLPADGKPDVRKLLESLPLATSKGGHFNSHLKAAAHDAGVALDVRLACASFTQAAQVVHSGAFAGILPETAENVLPAKEFPTFDPVPLVIRPRQLTLAWNRRVAETRPVIAEVAGLLAPVKSAAR